MATDTPLVMGRNGPNPTIATPPPLGIRYGEAVRTRPLGVRIGNGNGNGNGAGRGIPRPTGSPTKRDPLLRNELALVEDRLSRYNEFYRQNIWPFDRSHIAEQLRGIPKEFRRHLARDYAETYTHRGRRAANLGIREARETLGRLPFSLAADDEAIRAKADRLARECGLQITRFGLKAGLEYCQAQGIEPPSLGEDPETLSGVRARLRAAMWWRRRLRKTLSRLIESGARRFNLVNAHRAIYASDTNTRRRRSQKSRNRHILEALVAVNELGQEYTLAELADLSVTNPKLRRGELMVRMAGFEEYATTHGHVGIFYTMTCPSRMHRSLEASGTINPRWDGSTTPRDAQSHLNHMWKQARAAFNRSKLSPYGFRIAEPHHDGTPHWHLLLFGRKPDMNQVTKILQRYILKVDPDERGADTQRFRAIPIDRSKGTAAGYIAKYVAKNIDGSHVDAHDEDPSGRDPSHLVERIDTWASTWGIRQFQQVGGPPVTVWRELRRMSDGVSAGPFAKAWKAADSADWAEYMNAMGGHECPKASHPMKLWRAWSDKPGLYGNPIGDQIQGLCTEDVTFRTRIHAWRIEPKQVTTAKLNSENQGRNFAPSWSSVNNCTDADRYYGLPSTQAGPSMSPATTRIRWSG